MTKKYLTILISVHCAILNAQFAIDTISDSIMLDGYTPFYGGGLSFYDIDYDGWEELTVADPFNDIRIYINSNGVLNHQYSIPNTQDIKAVNWVDYDNDNDADLFVTAFNGKCKLHRNEGNFQFSDVSSSLGLIDENRFYFGSSWADYDRDGFLDVFICSYTLPGPGSYSNTLLRNLGNGNFEDVTFQLGLGNTFRSSFQSSWVDFNFDLWPDLYVVNDKHHGNELYLNMEGVFVDISEASGSNIELESMSNSIADYDRDGDWDIYVANSYFGNYLLNNNELEFNNVASELAVDCGSFCWGSTWMDVNNDDTEDLRVNSNTGAVGGGDFNFLFIQGHTGDFELTQIPDDFSRSFSCAKADYNNDGFWDFASYNEFPSEVLLWINTSVQTDTVPGNFIKVGLVGTASSNDAFGSLIEYFTDGNRHIRTIQCGEGFIAQDSQYEILGIDDNETVDSLFVWWPSGQIDSYYNLVANEFYVLVEGETYEVEISSNDGHYICSNADSLILDAGLHQSYQWSDGTNGQFLVVDSEGIYSVSSTNEFGITSTASFEVFSYPEVAIGFEATHPTCSDSANGSIVMVGDYAANEISDIQWNTGSDSLSIDDLSFGNYSCEVISEFGCSYSYAFELTAPPVISASIEVASIACFDGFTSLSYSTTGGTGALQVLSSFINPDTLYAGSHFIQFTDANGCSLTESFELTEPEIIAMNNETPSTCFGETVQAEYEMSGGTSPYAIVWCGADPAELQAGSYPIQINDSNGCQANLVFVVDSYEPISIESIVENAFALEDGMITLTVTGGLPPYDYSWSNGDTSNPLVNASQGTYQCSITDSAGCWVFTEIFNIVNLSVYDFTLPYTLFPIPFSDHLIVQGLEASTPFSLMDVTGRAVVDGKLSSSSHRIDTTQLPNGQYFFVSIGIICKIQKME